MERFRYTLTASTVVSAGQSDQRSNVRRAHQVIPGATLRGALGAKWWVGKNPDDPDSAEEFRRLFEVGLLVGQAVPEDFELLSASTLVCKYRSHADCVSFMRDEALSDPLAASLAECPVCHGPLASAAGWRRSPVQASTAPVLRTRGALTKRETAKKGKLFTRQAIGGRNGSACFTGVLITDEATADVWNGLALRVGGGRSLDYGNSHITMDREAWPDLPSTDTHVIRLVSPAILVDDFGGPVITTAALESELRRVSQQEGVVVHEEPSWVRSESVSGWHMRSKLPKRLDWAVAPGSVVIVDGMTAQGWARLQAGIGWRTLEGYGQIEVMVQREASRQDTRPSTRQASQAAELRPLTQGPPETVVDEKDVDQQPPPTDADNYGVIKLLALRPRFRKPKVWQTVKRDLLIALRRMSLAETAAALDLARSSANFSSLMSADRAAAQAVLSIPKSHVPGTLAQLEGMK